MSTLILWSTRGRGSRGFDYDEPMPRPGPAAAVALLVGAPAAAQLASYDAGLVGDLAPVPDPVAQGWVLEESGGALGAAAVAAVGASGWRAWEVADALVAPGAWTYAAPLGDAELQLVLAQGFELRANVAVFDAPSNSLVLEFATGRTPADDHWQVFVRQAGADLLVQPAVGPGFLAPGANDGGFHTIELVRDPALGGAEALVSVDGELLGPVAPAPGTFASPDGTARWGAIASAGTGRGQFHSVRFRTAGAADVLELDRDVLSLAAGGPTDLAIDFGAGQADDWYLVLGSFAGTSPGVLFDGVTIPLNVDAYWGYTLITPNAPPYTGSLGILDADGRASASLDLPPGLGGALVGATLHHSAITIALAPGLLSVASASNPAALQLVP